VADAAVVVIFDQMDFMAEDDRIRIVHLEGDVLGFFGLGRDHEAKHQQGSTNDAFQSHRKLLYEKLLFDYDG